MSPQQNRIVVLMLSFFAQISPRRGTRMKIPNLHANKLSNLRYLLILFVLFAGLPFRASAQDATIVGTVTDPSGSVIANAKITVANLETGLTRSITTNDSGQYVLPDLHIGHYDVKAEASGFKVAEQKGLVLNVGDRTRLDFQMQLGASQETVTVEANVVRVQADSGEVSNVIDGQQISQLAINGRGIYQLAALAPGASSEIDASAPNTPVGGSAGVEYNGLRQNHNIYLLDGGEDDDRGGAGGMSIAPSSDAIAEFRTLTSNYSADYGLSSAGTNVLVLKSGTSQIHASAWEFLRNDALDARRFFNPAPQKVAELRQNVFGFNAGGPVTFGKLYNPDKKKTFFFYNMEWRKYVNGDTIVQTVPDTATYTGQFPAGLTNTALHTPCSNQVSSATAAQYAANGQTLSTADPATGSCSGAGATLRSFTGNKIPPALLNANAQALLTAGGKYGGIFPGQTNGNQFQGGNNSPTNLKEEIVRIDHNFNSKFSIFGHFVAEQVSQTFGKSLWSGDNVPSVGTSFGNPSRSGVIHATYAISPTLLNETAFNYNGNVINIVPIGLFAAPTGANGFTFNRLFPGPNNNTRIPNIHLSGSTGTNYDIASWPWHNKADDYQIRDDISLTKGAHQLKFGASWAIYKKVQDLFGETQGQFDFNGNYTGLDFADYLLGLSDSYTELGVQDKGYWNNISYAAYVQDNWRVNKRLTLNLGLRWDGVPHTYEANNRMGNFYPKLYDPVNAAKLDTAGNICSGAADPGCTGVSPGLGTSPNSVLACCQFYLNGIGIPGKNGIPKGLVNTQWAAFGPRLGFAYDLTGSGKTVVRGGFGVMYERIQGNDMYDAGPNIPFSTSVTFTNVSLSNPSTSVISGNTVVAPITVASITGLAQNNYKLPVAYQYSVGVQHALSAKTVLSVSYVGNQSRHQNDRREINLPDPTNLPGLINGTIVGGYNSVAPFAGFHSLRITNNEANSHYNGMQVDLNSQVGRDLTLRAFYTLSRAVDPTTGGGGGSDLQNVSNPYAGWKFDVGPSGYDRTHNFSANFIYDIPVFRHNDNKLLKTAIGGWQVSGIVTIESGLPINITEGGKQSGNGVPNAQNRPDLASSVNYIHGSSSDPKSGNPIWFNPGNFGAPVFADPAIGAWGNVKFNSLRGPGRDNWNLSLFKDFVFSEARGSKLEFRVETFNTWNHTQFNGINTGFNSYNPPSATDPTGSAKGNFGQVNSAFDPRIIQLGLKLSF